VIEGGCSVLDRLLRLARPSAENGENLPTHNILTYSPLFLVSFAPYQEAIHFDGQGQYTTDVTSNASLEIWPLGMRKLSIAVFARLFPMFSGKIEVAQHSEIHAHIPLALSSFCAPMRASPCFSACPCRCYHHRRAQLVDGSIRRSCTPPFLVSFFSQWCRYILPGIWGPWQPLEEARWDFA